VPTIELYGQARLLAGLRSVEVDAGTLKAALNQLQRRIPELTGTVLTEDGRLTPAYTINLNGLRFVEDPDENLQPSDELLLISSLSGG
jgi:molybdopterin converting factor small subunit